MAEENLGELLINTASMQVSMKAEAGPVDEKAPGFSAAQSTNTLLNHVITYTLSNGEGSNKINKVYSTQLTLSAGGGLTFDLHSTSLLTVFGEPVKLTGIKGFMVQNLSTVAGDALQVGGAPSNSWNDWVVGNDRVRVLGSGMCAVMAPLSDGYTVVKDTADQLLISAESGNSADVVFNLILFGDT